MANDMLGRELKEGQTVVYPVHVSKGLAMGVATITDVTSDSCVKLMMTRSDGTEYNFAFTRLDRLVIAER